jgi:N6-adenosine-specific RNA methylase IME4
MKNEDILKLQVQNIADENCALFLWVTGPRFDVGIETLKSWGFRYVNVAFDWVKTNYKNCFPFKGVGHYTKSNPEWCILGMKGSLAVKSNKVYNLIEEYEEFSPDQIISPRQEHSRKPDIVRERIVELFGDIPRIELFARQRVKGFDCWGNQAPPKYSFL